MLQSLIVAEFLQEDIPSFVARLAPQPAKVRFVAQGSPGQIQPDRRMAIMFGQSDDPKTDC